MREVIKVAPPETEGHDRSPLFVSSSMTFHSYYVGIRTLPRVKRAQPRKA